MVKRALEGLKGVSGAAVGFRDKEARVSFDPTTVAVEELVRAIERAGFRASAKGARR